ncbi:FKBP-type peptidyl-prolyl cis-trans isomerase [Seonamhaeicola aphaedonensis]|uniref:Peptidyl-prolyl cis-trans isomerase n=1 Tax=Seonamhaeicola aphaedonensis TaxID=1461338 RepID=A0A3D9HFX5_9FLAO|nr:FKBP-type peptidyl-prolyl cis-trans isomerase [Seonamhaeicola aphaedonensis]RED47886.1 FKBP-type peptidyl-prolyl cis-trans isomerase FklB [Seonamhaeicola aphaedonensis]
MRIEKILSIMLVATLVVSCNKNGAQNKELKTASDSLSYAIGMDVARNVALSFKDDNFDHDLFYQGYRGVADSSDVKIDPTLVQGIIQTYMQKKQQEQYEKQQAEAIKKAEEQYADEKAAGEKLMAENISKEGVQTTESGLQYIVLKEGEGDKPTASDRVKVHYHGTLFDGTVFDSSVDRGEPTTFGVGQVIRGWTEGLQLMTVGSKYKFFIPQELAYGHQQRGEHIKPFTPLVFEVELIEIVK